MAPVFEIPLQDITVSDGERAVFECRVTGVPMPSVTWYVPLLRNRLLCVENSVSLYSGPLHPGNGHKV